MIMERFVSHYSCEEVEETGVVCLNILMDYVDEKRIYERKIKDLSKFAMLINKKILKNSIWTFPTIDILEKILIKKKYRHLIYREEKNNFFRIKQEKKVFVINEELITQLKTQPVLLLIDLTKLYGEKTAKIGWIVVLEYNEQHKEFIIYDPLYYQRISKGNGFRRLNNTPKNRYISVKKNHFFKSWESMDKIIVYTKGKKTIKPFKREFLTITKKVEKK